MEKPRILSIVLKGLIATLIFSLAGGIMVGCQKNNNNETIEEESYELSIDGVVSFNDDKQTKYRLEFDDEELTLPAIFQDGMVIQHGRPINIWGVGKPDADLYCALMDEDENIVAEKEGNIAADGTFLFQLKPFKPSMKNYSLSITSDGKEININYILFGDVYLTGGQSNMEYVLSDAKERSAILQEVKKMENLFIYAMTKLPRECNNMNSDFPVRPQFNLTGGQWGSSQEAPLDLKVSAVGLVFAMEQAKKVDYPVAFINTAVGGTVIESWLSREVIEDEENLSNFGAYYIKESQFNSYGNNNYNQMTAMYNTKMGGIKYYQCKAGLWYQGESNLAYNYGVERFYKALKMLIKDWEESYGIEKFVMSSLASFYYGGNVAHTGVAEFNNAMRMVTDDLENTALIPLYDLSNEYGAQLAIHPWQKLEVGKRFSRAYGGIKFPTIDSVEIIDNKMQITFKDVNGKLKVKEGNDLKGFSIAGSDGRFKPAKAKIISDNVVEIYSEEVTDPENCAYAFTTFTEQSNLCDEQGNMALQFTYGNAEKRVYPTGIGYLDCDSITAWKPRLSDNQYGKYEELFFVTGGEISVDNEVKSEGLGSIKIIPGGEESRLKITSRGYGELAFGQFDKLKVDVKGAEDVKLSVGIKTFTPTIADGEIDGFRTLIFDVSSLTANYDFFELLISGSQTVYVDNIILT